MNPIPAADWTDASLPLYNQAIGHAYAIERHHILPKKSLYKLFKAKSSYDKSLVNELANIALLTSQSDHTIFSYEPSVYLPNIESKFLKQQFVPLETALWQMEKESFIAFLRERRRLLAESIN
ncbi:MAG: hypothetical protein HC800_16780, partial [Phormidesmis sp. RL_2_1]|nr:hypothetical protein [Phormidesmis sp. RL_2_1]